ncbi:LamG domain-containing protein [Candidatus Pacearchaeota archaeon]|nr:LamG domain-containing protein [Candidatus Pacearchaeota archaeon]
MKRGVLIAVVVLIVAWAVSGLYLNPEIIYGGDAQLAPRQVKLDLIDCPGEGPCPKNLNPTRQCSDGRDNDNDGKIDYPNDPGCSFPSDNDEYNSVCTVLDGMVSWWPGETMSESENLFLTNTNPSEDVILLGDSYTIELVAASDSAAAIQVINSAGVSQSREINEGDSKSILDVLVYIANAEESNVSISADLKVQKGIAKDTLDDNDGTLLEETTNIPDGIVGEAFSFDGVDDYIQVPDADNLDVDSITIEGWIKPDRVGEDFYRIVSKDITGMDIETFDMFLGIDGNLQCIFRFVGNYTGFSVISSQQIPSQVWSHVACTYDELTGNLRYYFNGYLNQIDNPSEIEGPLIKSEEDLFIGADNTNQGNKNYFDGIIDELSIYNRALTDEEILSIYEAGSVGKCTETGPICGNGICEDGENIQSCYGDCCPNCGPPPTCGNGICSQYECEFCAGQDTSDCICQGG